MARKKPMYKNPFVIIVALILILVGIKYISSRVPTESLDSSQARLTCVNHSPSLAMHIHPELEIYINDEPVIIPANIGVGTACMRAIHTHDASGRLHLEHPRRVDFTLADFFANWGETFNQNELMGNAVDQNHRITMTVDGKPRQEFENLILRDKQRIVIRYEEITTSPNNSLEAQSEIDSTNDLEGSFTPVPY